MDERLDTLRNRAVHLRQRSAQLRHEVRVLQRQADEVLESSRLLCEEVAAAPPPKLRPLPVLSMTNGA